MSENVVPLPAARSGRVDATPAIRTPEQFARAVEALHGLVERAKAHDESLQPGDGHEFIGEAVAASPFVYKDGEIVRKGFSPKIVA